MKKNELPGPTPEAEEQVLAFIKRISDGGAKGIAEDLLVKFGENPDRWDGGMVTLQWLTQILAETKVAGYTADQTLALLIALMGIIAIHPVADAARRRLLDVR
jgi:spore maturation protein SpmB